MSLTRELQAEVESLRIQTFSREDQYTPATAEELALELFDPHEELWSVPA